METNKLDILVKNTEITEKYETFFDIYNHRGHDFEPVDPNFKKFLAQQDTPRDVVIRELFMNPEVELLDDFRDYLDCFENNPMALSLSAQTIIRFFLQNQADLTMENWFILNTKKINEPCTIGDIRIVRIKYLNETAGVKKYWLYCHLYGQWGALSRSLREDSKFFIPVAYSF